METLVNKGDSLLQVIEDLTGQSAPFKDRFDHANFDFFSRGGLGYSQLNEVLLTLGLDRVSHRFFQVLFNRNVCVEDGASFKALNELRNCVDEFRKWAILRFGSVKYGFKYLSAESTDLDRELEVVRPIPEDRYALRHEPVIPIQTIDGNKTYYLGYIVERELNDRIAVDPNDAEALAQIAEREQIVEVGRRNHDAYLVYDHMDVYVATSMRERHEFAAVNDFVKQVFGDPCLLRLKVRWFDPTQAYCSDRIDKGLAEALMLKRAKCTLYLAQESDTLGKDSELACTLAQGKPVIAYVPQFKSDAEAIAFLESQISELAQDGSVESQRNAILAQMRVFKLNAAWSNPDVRRWIDNPESMEIRAAKSLLATWMREHYDNRAKTLKESHPLGLQVNLDTGVACGVLVARTANECAQLIRMIMTETMEFDIDSLASSGGVALRLRERLTGSIFRVVTGDAFLTNAFWNFYVQR